MYIPIGAAKIVLFLHIRKKKVQVESRKSKAKGAAHPCAALKSTIYNKALAAKSPIEWSAGYQPA